jgi:hypothetical protein
LGAIGGIVGGTIILSAVVLYLFRQRRTASQRQEGQRELETVSEVATAKGTFLRLKVDHGGQ